MVITSKDNQIIKKIKKLKEHKYRKEKFIIEGMKMLEEAFQENADIDAIVVNHEDKDALEKVNDMIKDYPNMNNIEMLEVTPSIFMILSDVKTPQGVIAVIRKNDSSGVWDRQNELGDTYTNINNKNEHVYNEIDTIDANGERCNKNIDEFRQIDVSADYILAIDGIQDPGNLGTIIRTADSANLKQILVSKDTVDAFSPKVIRSTMGAIFRVKIIECENLEVTLERLKKYDFKIVSTSLDTENSIYDIDYSKKIVVIGNEGNGVSKEIQDLSDYKVKIPMIGKTESLNASVAAGIMIYEFVRQKYNKK